MANRMTDILPILPLQTVVFPEMRVPVSIFEERYNRMLDEYPGTDPAFGVVLLRSGRDTDPISQQRSHSVGTAVRIVSRHARSGGGWKLILEGTKRFTAHRIQPVNGYGLATVDWVAEDGETLAHTEEKLRETLVAYQAFVEAVTTATAQPFPGVRVSNNPLTAAWDIASRLPMSNQERQQVLELNLPSARLAMLTGIIQREICLIESLGLVGVPLDYAGGGISLN